MPGFNQRGPQGTGPMTGRGQGVCTNQNISRAGAGGVTGLGGRGCGLGFGGDRRGMGRGMGRGFGHASSPTTPGITTETALQDRVRRLEDEFNAVKARLNPMPEDRR